MENNINETYLKLIQEYIEEARKAPEAVPTSLFFKDNIDAKFFSVISQIKTGDLVDYYFGGSSQFLAQSRTDFTAAELRVMEIQQQSLQLKTGNLL